jgi:hypothetical protein
LQKKTDHHVKWSKPDWERQISHVLSHTWSLVLKIKWQECKTGSVWGLEPVGVGGEWKKKVEAGEQGLSALYTSMKIEQWTCWNCFKKGRGRVRGNYQMGEKRGTLYTCMEISQWNTFAQLIYANKIGKKERVIQMG